MLEHFFWDYFRISGNIDAYMAYKDMEQTEIAANYGEYSGGAATLLREE